MAALFRPNVLTSMTRVAKVPIFPSVLNVLVERTFSILDSKNLRKCKLKELVDRHSYELAPRLEVPIGVTILKSNPQLCIKTEQAGTEKFKSSLIVQGHKHPKRCTIITEAATVLQTSVRLILSLSLSPDFKLSLRDVEQAFFQSNDPLKSQLFIRTPKDSRSLCHFTVRQPFDSCLHASKPLHGPSESL